MWQSQKESEKQWEMDKETQRNDEAKRQRGRIRRRGVHDGGDETATEAVMARRWWWRRQERLSWSSAREGSAGTSMVSDIVRWRRGSGRDLV